MGEGETGGVRAEGPSGAEWALLFALLLGVVAYGFAQWHPFVLPNNDYYSFEQVARSLAHLQLPKDFKRLPAFPALIALVRPLMGGRHPWLSAALAVNAVCALATLGLLFAYARRAFAPRERSAAILVPLLVACTGQFHAMGLQPLVEPTLGFFLVLAFVLHQRRSLFMYAAGFAVGLGRVEAATVVPVFFLLGVLEERPLARGLRRHLLPAALAASGLLLWTGLGAVYGKGQNFYLELMQSMGWKPALDFPLRVLSEAFAFLNVYDVPVLLALLAMTAVPLALGIAYGLRAFPREARALLLYFGVSVTVVSFFGVDKARYAYVALWIPLLFCVPGLLALRDWATERLSAWAGPEPPARVLRALAALACLATLAGWVAFAQTRPRLAPPLADAAFTVGCTALAAWVLLRRLPPPRVLRQAMACLALVFAITTIGSGIARMRTALSDIHYANYASVVLAGWIEENLGDQDRMVVLSRKHLQFLTGLPRDRFVPFSRYEVESPEALAAIMRRDDCSYLAWTHRDEVTTRSAAYYHELLNVGLAERFRSGGPVPGFEHVATLPVPRAAEASDVQIYRLAP